MPLTCYFPVFPAAAPKISHFTYSPNGYVSSHGRCAQASSVLQGNWLSLTYCSAAVRRERFSASRAMSARVIHSCRWTLFARAR
jgi:hypothetical protein